MNEEMKNLIMAFIEEDECETNCSGDIYNCESCSNFEECYADSNIRCNSDFAESINYGGYDSEEEFWGQLLD